MRRSQGKVESTGIDGEGKTTVHVRCSPELRPDPGQALLLLHSSRPSSMRHTVHPNKIRRGGFRMRAPDNGHWQPGDTVDLLGPIGRPFRPPERARRWLLVAFGAPVSPLLPLIDIALANGADVTLASSSRPAGLPSDVEVLRSPGEALPWADYLAACVPRKAVGELLLQLGGAGPSQLRGRSEIMVLSTLPCGIGACGICAVPTSDGWSLSCQMGPVYPLSQLRE